MLSWPFRLVINILEGAFAMAIPLKEAPADRACVAAWADKRASKNKAWDNLSALGKPRSLQTCWRTCSATNMTDQTAVLAGFCESESKLSRSIVCTGSKEGAEKQGPRILERLGRPQGLCRPAGAHSERYQHDRSDSSIGWPLR